MGPLLHDIARVVSAGDADGHVRSGALAVAKQLANDEKPPRSPNTIPGVARATALQCRERLLAGGDVGCGRYE